MKVVILSRIDWTSSAMRLYEAIKKYTSHEMYYFSGADPLNKFNHPTFKSGSRKEIQKIINESDIIHFKGDWPPGNGYLGFTIPNKPTVSTVSGSHFRKKIHNGFEDYKPSQFNKITLKTSFEPDLLYPEYSDIWTPHPIDSEDKKIIWKPTSHPIFMHIPSNPQRKATEFVEKVFNILKKRISCTTEIITGVDFKTAIEAKKRATMYFDQFRAGFYGNSALEAMQWGIPTVAWISPIAIEQAKGQLEGCPVINENQSNPEKTAERIISLVNDEELSRKTKEWCDNVHSYRVVADQWNKLYTTIK